MRMWMIDPRQMCRQHLLGEHVELHMFVGSLERQKRIDGFMAQDQLEPQSIHARHEVLVAEMTRRGYNHGSPMNADYVRRQASYLPEHYLSARIDQDAAQRDLHGRCGACRAQAAVAQVRQRRRRHNVREEECTSHSQST